MQKSQIFTQQELTILRKKGVDTELCEVILNDYNRGKIGKNPPLTPLGVPDIDGEQILNLRAPSFFYFKEEEYRRFKSLYPQASSFLHPENNKVSLKEIEKAGIALLPCFAFGFLNGGSATSYGDVRKNRAFNQDLFELYEEDFLRLSAKVKGQPKGITPAFNRKGEEKAPSYMELKLRSLLLLVKKYRELCGEGLKEGIPFFQMTSLATDSPVKEALKTYRKSPWLKPLAESLNIPPWQGFTAQQPLLAAYSHSKEGEKKKIFRKEDASFPFILLPGGHGQCFRVLGKVWQQLYDRGIRYVSLGNIDNLGYTPDPVELALMAIKQAPAGFDQSWKTAVDTKGGVLVVTEGGRLNCADIGAGISSRDIKELEKSGKKILFNCASGLFDLSWLLKNLNTIIKELPLRFSDQSKDAGEYSQAEQITWEVIGMIDRPLIFAVDKYKRFLAAKILVENMMTSGLHLEDPRFPGTGAEGDLKDTARKLNKGLKKLLNTCYALKE